MPESDRAQDITTPGDTRQGNEPPSSERGISRRKDPDIIEMADTLEHFETILRLYIQSLSDELVREREREDPYPMLVTGLEGMIAMLKDFGTFFDDEVWTRMIAVADRSTSHVARRTRRFF